MQAVKNALYFSGMWLHNLSISTEWPEYRTIGDGWKSLRSDPETTIMFDVFSKNEIRWWGDFGHSGHAGNFGILGKGWVCHHCGDYNPSGCVHCLKCGGIANAAFVRPVRFDFYVQELQQAQIWRADDEACPTTISLSCDGDHVIESLHAALFEGQQFFKANGYNLESGYYLCQYCGFGVRDGEICPGCSGKRVPFSEIVKLNRVCVYCGCESLGSLVCKGCGARIKGMTFKQAKLN